MCGELLIFDTNQQFATRSFDFTAIPSLNKTLVLELARSEYVARSENVIALGNSGTGKIHIALGLGLAACQKGLPVGFTTAAALVQRTAAAESLDDYLAQGSNNAHICTDPTVPYDPFMIYPLWFALVWGP